MQIRKRTMKLLLAASIVAMAPFHSISGQELIQNGEFSESNVGWVLERGDGFGHDAAEGHDFPGAARVTGEDGGGALIRQCVDISSLPSGESFDMTGCVRAVGYDPQVLGIDVAYFQSVDCTSGFIVNEQFFAMGTGQDWHRTTGTVTPPPEALAIEILPQVLIGATPEGVTLFDSVSLQQVPIFRNGFEDGTLEAWQSFP